MKEHEFLGQMFAVTLVVRGQTEQTTDQIRHWLTSKNGMYLITNYTLYSSTLSPYLYRIYSVKKSDLWKSSVKQLLSCQKKKFCVKNNALKKKGKNAVFEIPWRNF